MWYVFVKRSSSFSFFCLFIHVAELFEALLAVHCVCNPPLANMQRIVLKLLLSITSLLTANHNFQSAFVGFTDKNCQRAIKKTNIDQPSAARLRLEVQFLSKVMCIITSPSGPKVKAAISSWAKLCDGLLVVTFENNTLMNRSSIEEQYQGVRFLQLPKVPGQTLSTDFGSSMAAWRFIKASFVDRFGWFISVPDATLVIIANLKRYLSLLDYNPETRGKPIFAGHPVHLRSGLVVNTLRAGVILNRKALAALIQSAFDHATGTKLTFEPLECTSFAESTNATDEFDRLTVAYQTLRGDDHFVARQGKQRTALDVLPFDMQTRILSKPRKLMPTGGSADAGARPEMASAGNRGQEQEPEPEQKKEWKEEKENDDEIKREENAMLPDPCPLWKLGKRLSFEETTCDEGQPGMPAEFCIALLLSSNGVRPHDTRDLSEAHRFHILPANATALTKPWGKLSEEQQQKTEPYPNLPGESGVSRQTITMPVRPGLRHIRELEALTAFLGKKCYPLVLSKDFDDEFGRGARLLEKQRVYRWLRRRCTLAVGEMLDGWIAPTTSTRTTTSNPALESNPRRLVKQPKEPPPFNASKCRQVNWSEVNFTDANIDTAVYTMTELMPALEHLARLGNFTLESRPTL